MVKTSRVDAIVDAARSCIAEGGVATATFERIAERAGVSHGLVHYHFGSKDKLLLAVCRDTCTRQTAALASALSAPGDRTAVVERLRAMLELFLGSPSGFRLLSELWTLAAADEAVRGELARLYAEQRAALAQAITSTAVARGAELRASPDAIAGTILAVADGISIQASIDPESDVQDVLEAAVRAAEWLTGETGAS